MRARRFGHAWFHVARRFGERNAYAAWMRSEGNHTCQVWTVKP